MRCSTLSLLALPALALAQTQTTAAPESAPATAVPEVTQVLSAPAPGEAWQQEANMDEDKQLELRQATGQNLGAVQATTSAGDVTSYWIASFYDKTLTSEIWVDAIYTQTFETHPGKWTTAGAGSIGLGTHTGVVGVVKDTKQNAGSSVLPQGTLLTAAIGLASVALGMAAVLL